MRTVKAALVVALLILPGIPAFSQGNLTPPGPPVPTMKSLDQVEARTPLAGGTTPITISAPGSYYLTGNLTVASGDAISIAANSVALDLNGFTVATTATTPSGTAVFLKQGVFRCVVSNGFIVGSGSATSGTFGGGGFVDGVNTEGPVAENCYAHDLVVNGCSRYGIRLTSSGYGADRVERCSVENVGSTGITAEIVRNCTVFYCADMGISASDASDCFADARTQGIYAGNANNCTARALTGAGLACTTCRGCIGTSRDANGINAEDATASTGTAQGAGTGLNTSTAVGCRGSSGSSFGLYAITANACQGTSTTGIGLQTAVGTDCLGSTTSGSYGAYANIFTNSQGGTTGTGVALNAAYAANNCLGISTGGDGIRTTNATNCYGESSSPTGRGIFCGGTANNCQGSDTATGGIAISARILIGCTAGAGGSLVGSKFLGTP